MQEELLLKLIDFKGNKIGSNPNSASNNLDYINKVQSELAFLCLKDSSFISDNESNKFSIFLSEENIAQNLNILKLLTQPAPNTNNQTNFSPSNYSTQPNSQYSNYPNTMNYGNMNFAGIGYNYNQQNYYQNNQNYLPQQTGMNSSPSNNYPYQKKKTKGLFDFGYNEIDTQMSKIDFRN